MPQHRLGVALLAGCLLLLAACAPKTAAIKKDHPQSPTAHLALAGYSNPRLAAELVDGLVADRANVVHPDVLDRANAILAEELSSRRRPFASLPAVRQCQDVVSREQGLRSNPASALDHWIKVGRCLPTDLLLVPQILYFRDRMGGSLGVDQPASVVIHFSLIDVKNQRLAGRYVFDETQRSLSENLLDVDKFVKRRGQWITAYDLLREAARAAIRELHL